MEGDHAFSAECPCDRCSQMQGFLNLTSLPPTDFTQAPSEPVDNVIYVDFRARRRVA